MSAWQSSLKTGIKEVDRQHKELFNRMGSLMRAVEKGRNHHQQAIETLLFLEVYVIEHFATEEALMERYAYPQAREHRVLHQSFRNDVAFLGHEVKGEAYNPGLATDLIHHMTEWFVDHILDVDRAMCAFVREEQKRAAGREGVQEAKPGKGEKKTGKKKGRKG